MLDLIKLHANRQRRVLLALLEVRDDKVFLRSLHDRVRDGVEGAVLAGQALGTRHSVRRSPSTTAPTRPTRASSTCSRRSKTR